MYTAILLNKPDQERLKSLLKVLADAASDWQVYCHHLTLNMGPMSKGVNNTELLNQEAVIHVDAAGMNEYAVAVRATQLFTKDGTELKSTNKTPHITMAVNVHNGGKPFMSNSITMWCSVENLTFCGKVVEIG